MKLSFSLLLVLATKTLMAQAQNTQELINQSASNNLQTIYHKTVQYKQNVFTGIEYFRNYGKINGHAFWNENEFINGNVGYDGNIYPNLPLKLDLMVEELITHGVNQGVQIKIIREKIDSFTIGSVRFLHLTPDKNKVPDGFYEILHSQKYTVFCKRNKLIKEVIVQNELERNIEEEAVYFLKNQDNIIVIKNRQILFDLFRDKKNQVLDYMSNLNLNFRKQKEAFIVESIKYYEQITN